MGVTFILHIDIKTTTFLCKQKCFRLSYLFLSMSALFLCICWSMMPLIFIEIHEKLIKIRNGTTNIKKNRTWAKEENYE